jgi:hypothetical protein
MLPTHQILMGAAVAVLSLVAFLKTDWLLRNTGKGEWLARRCGESRARLYVRMFFFFAAVFGLLLATNVVRPLQW